MQKKVFIVSDVWSTFFLRDVVGAQLASLAVKLMEGGGIMVRMTMNFLILISLCCIVFAAEAGAMKIATNFWDVAWGNWDIGFGMGTADPFINHGGDFGYQNVTGDNPWKPEFLEEVSVYTGFRFMDWGKTNNAAEWHTGRWADRTQKSAKQQYPVAYEWMIDLCNRLGKDCWICVPHVADDNYVDQLAVLVYEQLDPGLVCYIEHSNETWNGGFAQTGYCNSIASSIPGLTTGNIWYDGQRYHSYRSFRIFDQFENVFGKNSPRLRKVMGGTSGHAFCETSIEIMKSSQFNPSGTRMDMYSIAPYVGRQASSLDGILSSIGPEIQATQHVITACKNEGIELIAYEGGQHLTTNADDVSRDPGIYAVYKQYLDVMSQILTEFWHYAHSGVYGSGGAWGAKESIGQPVSQAHKYRALVDWSNENPSVAVLSGSTTGMSSLQPCRRTTALFTLDGRYLGGSPALAPSILIVNRSTHVLLNTFIY